DLDGHDAISGLWTVFTKCKESLQDGPRLENISWRLWYRELATHTRAQRHLPTPPHDSPPHSPHPNTVTCPLTPVSEKGSSERLESRTVSPASGLSGPTGFFSSRTRSLPPLSIPQLQSPPAGRRPRLLSSRSKPNPPSVGKIICDMIPDKLDLAAAKPPSVLVNPDPVIVAADPGAMLVAPIPSMLLPPPSTPPTAVGIFPRPPSPIPSSAQNLAPPPRLSAACEPASSHRTPQLLPTPCLLRSLLPLLLSSPQPQPQPNPKPQRPMDDTLKPSDRRFFLQQDQSPSPEPPGKSPSETGEVQPSSVTAPRLSSTQMAAVAPPGTHLLVRRWRGSTRVVTSLPKPIKLPHPRPLLSPSNHHRRPQHMNGVTSNSGGAGAGTGTGAPRRGIVTTDTEEDDDDSWASGDISEGPAEAATMRPTNTRPPTKEETRLREAVVEAQRQRELFVKQPKRSYSNLGRTQSRFVVSIAQSGSDRVPPGRPYRVLYPIYSHIEQVARCAPPGCSSQRTSAHGGSHRWLPTKGPLAQQRLAALANPARRRASDNQVQPQAPGMGLGGRPLLQTVATAPIPLNHPWNLPMLATELSESLRRNLLWERQVSKTSLLGNGGRRNGNVFGWLRWYRYRGMRAVATVNGNAQAAPQRQGNSAGPGDGATGATRLARNRTWDDFHYLAGNRC
ncbi:hypothetical protein EDB85DRAFT_2038652, partial [Lactarius pseudohatsudake]